MHILEELWNGSLCPSSREDYRRDEYQDLMLLCQRNEEKLLPTLSDSQKEGLKKIQKVVEKMQELAECGAFINGFQLAVRLMSASVGAWEQ